MPNYNYNEQEARMLANLLGKPALPTPTQPAMPQAPIQNMLPIPVNENNMPMFATDTEYLNYLQEYDPDMYIQMQNQYMNTRGGMSEGKIDLNKPINFVKGLLGL